MKRMGYEEKNFYFSWNELKSYPTTNERRHNDDNKQINNGD